jgi:hypothetical protein
MLSSTEAEYMALTEAAKHAAWTTQMLMMLGFGIDFPVSIYCDLKGACEITSNNIFHRWTKHINICHHYIHEKVTDTLLRVEEVDLTNNTADTLTESLPKPAHWRHLSAMGLDKASNEGEC